MSKKNLYIIGARGFGRECASYFSIWPGFLDRYNLCGFLDDNSHALDEFPGYPPIVSSVEDFIPSKDDAFVCALGIVKWRRKYIEMIKAKGGVFETIVAPSAKVLPTAKLGNGVLILDGAVVSADVIVGDDTLIHLNAVLGHDTRVGKDCVIETGAFTGGGVELGSGVTLHTNATIAPHKKVKDDAVVGASSVVIANVASGVTVFGIPAMPF